MAIFETKGVTTARAGEGKDRIGVERTQAMEEKRGRCRENARGYKRKAPETSKKCRAVKAKRIPRVVMARCQGLLRVSDTAGPEPWGRQNVQLSPDLALGS